MRRRISPIGILLATAASCTTVPPQEFSAVNRDQSGSPFRLVEQPVSASAVATSPSRSPADAVADVALAEFQEKDSSKVDIAFQDELPPAPLSAQDEAREDSSARRVSEPLSEIANGLTLDQAISTALSRNPTLPEAAASVRRLQAERAQSGFCPNPTVGYIASEVGNEGRAGQQGIYIGQTFVTADKLDHNRAVASGGVSFAQAQVEAQRLRVVTDTTILFYEALGAQRLLEIARQIEQNASSNLEASRSRFEFGEVGRADVLQAEAEYQRATVAVRQGEARVEASWRRLAAMLGDPGLPPVPLVGSLESDRIADEFEAVWLRLRSISPELQAASARVARTRARIGREQAQAIPDIDTQQTIQYDASTLDTVVGLQWAVPVPIIHKNEGAIAAAQAEHVRACRDYQRTELELRDRLAEAFRDLTVARAQAEAYREQVIPTAQESLELVREGYRQGEFDVLRLITSQQVFANASAEYVKALVDLRTAEARIDGLLLTGGLDEPIAPEPVGGFGGLADVPRAE